MVLSSRTKTASIASISNANQGGGSKKAGLPYQVGVLSGPQIHRRDFSGYFALGSWQTNRTGITSNLSRPVGPGISNSYFKISF